MWEPTDCPGLSRSQSTQRLALWEAGCVLASLAQCPAAETLELPDERGMNGFLYVIIYIYISFIMDFVGFCWAM